MLVYNTITLPNSRLIHFSKQNKNVVILAVKYSTKIFHKQ